MFRILSMAAAAAVFVSAQSGGAEARDWWLLSRMFPEFAEPPPEGFYYDEFDEEEGEVIVVPSRRASVYVFEDDYYEPEYVPLKKRPLNEKKPGKLSKANKPAAAAVKRQNQQASFKPDKKPAQAGAALSCDKGSKIVADYGFSEVKPVTCTGKIYTFSATRAAKRYEVRVSAVNGKLTDVKKIQ
jgi:hypothetical protein